MTVITSRPPMRSARMPAGRRQIAPLSTATAVIQDSWTSVRPNSLRMGMPSTPNINHTANIKVKPTVEITSTRTAPGRRFQP
jgi:hypothetical protein